MSMSIVVTKTTPTPTRVSSFARAENSRTFSSTTSLEPGRNVSKMKPVSRSPASANSGRSDSTRYTMATNGTTAIIVVNVNAAAAVVHPSSRNWVAIWRRNHRQ